MRRFLLTILLLLVVAPLAFPAGASPLFVPLSQYVVYTVLPGTDWLSVDLYPSGVSGLTLYALTDVPSPDRPLYAADTFCGTSYVTVTSIDIGFSEVIGGTCTNIRIRNESEEFSFDIAIAGPSPTATVAASSTPTSEVLVTPSPVPTPTLSPSDIALHTRDMVELQTYLVLFFGGCVLVGLVFVVARLR